MKFVALSDVGCARERNEDMCLIDGLTVRDDVASGHNCNRCAAVADGLGGHHRGDVASYMACHRFETWVETLPEGLDQEGLKNAVDRFVKLTHGYIIRHSYPADDNRAMGTTLVGVFSYEGRWWWLNIGDSRLYLYRDGQLAQISTDHSLNKLDPTAPSNVMYNCLGGSCDIEAFADFGPLDLKDGDRLQLCSDGLTDMLSDAEIEALLDSNASVYDFVWEAMAAGSPDNISLILLTYQA